MSAHCRIEFYFKAADLEKLLKENPDAKGIIVSQEIVKEKPHGMDRYVNVTHIRAKVDKGSDHSAKMKAGPGDDESIDGCPYPPGCN